MLHRIRLDLNAGYKSLKLLNYCHSTMASSVQVPLGRQLTTLRRATEACH